MTRDGAAVVVDIADSRAFVLHEDLSRASIILTSLSSKTMPSAPAWCEYSSVKPSRTSRNTLVDCHRVKLYPCRPVRLGRYSSLMEMLEFWPSVIAIVPIPLFTIQHRWPMEFWCLSAAAMHDDAFLLWHLTCLG